LEHVFDNWKLIMKVFSSYNC